MVIRRVVVESPYSGDIQRNRIYALRAMADCLNRGEAPMVSHLLYTSVLDDEDPEQRMQGIQAGLAWVPVSNATVVYTDLGITQGMKLGIERAEREHRVIEYREIGADA